LLPTQLGKHFWPNFSSVSGIRIDYLSPTFYTTDLIPLLLFICFVIRWCKTQNKSKIQLKNKKFLLLVVVFLFLVCNIIFSSRPLLSIYGFIKFLELGFFAWYVAKTIHYRFQLLHISVLFACSALFESALAILQYLNQASLNGVFYFFGERAFTGTTPGIANASINGELILRPYATFPHPNVLAGYLLITMVLLWSFLLTGNSRWMKILGALSLLISSIALLLTFSRIAILIWGGLILFVLIKKIFKSLKTRKVRLLFFVVVFLCLLLLSMLPISHEVFSRFAQTSLYEESVTERTELLSASWILIQQHLLLGVGIDNFIPALAPLQKPLPLNLYLQPVHTIFVLIAVETGIIGFGLFIWLLITIFLKLRKAEAGVKEPFFVLFLIILVTGLFDHYWITLQQGQLLFATVIGLGCSKFPFQAIRVTAHKKSANGRASKSMFSLFSFFMKNSSIEFYENYTSLKLKKGLQTLIITH
jgi:O-antigen ligase